MANRNFMLVDNFKMSTAEKQMALLAEFVLEAMPSGNDVDVFNNRLKIYAARVGIDEATARQRVRKYIQAEHANKLRSYGL